MTKTTLDSQVRRLLQVIVSQLADTEPDWFLDRSTDSATSTPSRFIYCTPRRTVSRLRRTTDDKDEGRATDREDHDRSNGRDERLHRHRVGGVRGFPR